MRFGRTPPAATVSGPDVDRAGTPFELAAVELLMTGGPMTGWIATDGQRTSDWLNRHDRVPLLGLAPRGAAQPPGPAPTAEPTDVDRDQIIWVVPPPLPANRHLRLHRRRILVHLELEEHRIIGQVHVRPGADASDQVLRGPRELIPLTEAQVVARANPQDGASVPVLIVNRHHVRHVTVDAPHQSSPVAEPEWPSDLRPVAASDGAPGTEPSVGESHDAGPAIETGADLVNSALVILLETGIIDVVEFQTMRARVPSVGGSDRD